MRSPTPGYAFGCALGCTLGFVVILGGEVLARRVDGASGDLVQTAASPAVEEAPSMRPAVLRKNAYIEVWHDDARGVTCWLYPVTGFSCLPDASFASTNPPVPK